MKTFKNRSRLARWSAMISGLGSSRDQIETTCLSSTERTYEAGLKTPSQMRSRLARWSAMISGLGSSRDQIETTCLSSTERTYEAGLKTPSSHATTTKEGK